jgi:DNA-binding CsgD family transcriptional regulator
VSFPTFDLRVFQSLEELEQKSEALRPDICLFFGSQFTHLTLTETLLFVREKFRTAKILQVEGVAKSTVRQVWPAPAIRNLSTNPQQFDDVESLDSVIRNISSGWEALMAADKSLTASQIGILVAVASGQSNREIADARGTSTRAVESLVNRTFSRLGLLEKHSARTRSVKAQEYLAGLGIATKN